MWIINATNIEAFKLVKYIASPQLNVIMHYLGESFIVILPILALYLLLKKDKNVFSFVLGIVVFYIVGDIIKLIVREPRPCNVSDLSWINNIGCEASFSFPSNHATVLTGLYAFMNKYKYVRILYIVWLVLVLFGRVYLGLHYFTDVVAGVILSIVMIYLLYKVKDRINSLLSSIFCRLFGPICKRVGW